MKRKIIVIFVSVLILMSFVLLSLPSVSAEHTTKDKDVDIQAGKTYEIIVETDEGKLKYTWKIYDFDDDKNLFYYGKKGDSRELEIYDLANRSGEISVKSGKYVFGWRNNNPNGSFSINYKVTYPKPPEGCYSSILILSILSIVSVVWLSGNTRKKEFR